MSISKLCQDYIYLGPAFSPGKCVIRGAGDPRKWDVVDGGGIDGASTKCMGKSPARFEVEFTLWTQEHFALWEVFGRALFTSKAMRMALGINHPLLRFPPLNISAVVVEDISQFEQSEEGLWTCVVKFLEFRRPKQIGVVKPMAAIPAGETPPPTPQSPEEVRIMQQLAEAKALLTPAGAPAPGGPK